jgi:hypothetical protein
MQIEALWNGLRDNSGEPLAGGYVYQYQGGTTTAATLYTTMACGTVHANPLVLDAYGRALAFGYRDYKFVVCDSAGTTLFTHDDLNYSYWNSSNDGTGSGLDADKLEGRHAGNTIDLIPISDGTLCVGLNAQKLGGYQASNATGSIPINNGTVNTGLNANYLAGYSAGNATGNIPISNGTYNAGLNAAYLNGSNASSFLTTAEYTVCWAYLVWGGGGMTPYIYDSRGVSTVSVNNTGDFGVVWATPFSTAYSYAVTLTGLNVAGDPVICGTNGKTASSAQIITISDDGTAEDAAFMNVIAVGIR